MKTGKEMNLLLTDCHSISIRYHTDRNGTDPKASFLPVHGDSSGVVPESQMQHLSCFTGGIVGISNGAKILSDTMSWQLRESLCVWAYNSTQTGIMPELSFSSCSVQGSRSMRMERGELVESYDIVSKPQVRRLGSAVSTPTRSN